MRKGFCAYWQIATLRAWADLVNFLATIGIDRKKIIWNCTTLVTGYTVAILLFDISVYEKVIWSLITIGGLSFAVSCVFAFFFFRAPWKLDEASVIRQSQLVSEVTELKQQVAAKDAELQAKQNAWENEINRVKNSDPQRNIHRQKIRDEIADFKRILANLQSKSPKAITEFCVREQRVNVYLIKTHDYDRFGIGSPIPARKRIGLCEMAENAKTNPGTSTPLYGDDDFQDYAQCCEDRIKKLEALLECFGDPSRE